MKPTALRTALALTAGVIVAGGSVYSQARASIDLAGRMHKVLFKQTVARVDSDGRSGCTPGDPAFVNLRHEDTFKGEQGRTYDVAFRIRGVVEPKVYEGGRPDPVTPFVNIGGAPSTTGKENASNQYLKFSLEVSDPKEVYYLNRFHGSHTDHEVYPMDYRLTVKVLGGAQLALVLANGNQCAITNYRNKVVEGLPADVIVQPFKDQFLYVEVESISEAR